MMSSNTLILLVLVFALFSCGSSIEYPTTYTYDSIEIERTRTVKGINDGMTREIEPTSQHFTEPILILESFGAPAQVASITLLSETELKVTSVDNQEGIISYEKIGAQLYNPDFSVILNDSDNFLSFYGCMNVISSVTSGFRVDANVCFIGDDFVDMDRLFSENNLVEGDTLGFTFFKANYR